MTFSSTCRTLPGSRTVGQTVTFSCHIRELGDQANGVIAMLEQPARAAPPGWQAVLLALPPYRYAVADPCGHWEASPSPVYGAALLMRFGFAPIRGSNPRASAR